MSVLEGLEGKRVIVTGAAGGFGAAIARRFGAAGARVVVADLDDVGARDVAGTIEGAVPLQVDMTSPLQIQAMVSTAMDAFGGLDVLINNAGTTHRSGPTVDLDVKTFDAQVALNVRSVFLGAKYAVPHMEDGSVIVNTASIAGKRPRPGVVTYNATKGAVLTLTRGLANELAPRIRVNAVCPVAAQTNFMTNAFGDGGLTGDMFDKIVGGIPMGRIAEPDDVASAVLFLSSPRSGFLTGVCLDVDGGRSIQ
jgi:3-oxoacyl-[acyl-carrier protein] reductase